MPKFGIDVSLWQKGIDFKKAKAEGVEFVIIKCSQSDYKDPQFENHYKAAKAVGLPVGAYHFCTATTVEEAKKEAETCLKAIKGKTFEYPIFLDFENSSGVDYRATGKATNDAIIKTFCETLEKAKYWVGIYFGLEFYKFYTSGPELASRYSHWLPYWATKAPIGCQMWQFGGETNKLRSNKIAGMVCDQNYCYIDYPSLIKAKGLNGYRTVDDLAKEVIAGKWGAGLARRQALTKAGYNYSEVQARVNELLK